MMRCTVDAALSENVKNLNLQYVIISAHPRKQHFFKFALLKSALFKDYNLHSYIPIHSSNTFL